MPCLPALAISGPDYLYSPACALPRRYERALRQNNAVDFDDLMGLAVALLRRREDVRERYQRRFKWVLLGAGRTLSALLGMHACLLGPAVCTLPTCTPSPRHTLPPATRPPLAPPAPS